MIMAQPLELEKNIGKTNLSVPAPGTAASSAADYTTGVLTQLQQHLNAPGKAEQEVQDADKVYLRGTLKDNTTVCVLPKTLEADQEEDVELEVVAASMPSLDITIVLGLMTHVAAVFSSYFERGRTGGMCGLKSFVWDTASPSPRQLFLQALGYRGVARARSVITRIVQAWSHVLLAWALAYPVRGYDCIPRTPLVHPGSGKVSNRCWNTQGEERVRSSERRCKTLQVRPFGRIPGGGVWHCQLARGCRAGISRSVGIAMPDYRFFAISTGLYPAQTVDERSWQCPPCPL